MQHINRLLIHARQAKAGKGKHIICFVDYDCEKNKYSASGRIWDGVPGSVGDEFHSEHDTQSEAIEACDAVAAQYQGCEHLVFIMDDIGFSEGD